MEKLYLLDASGFLYRSYFAIQGLSSGSGEATGALFGFVRSYLKLVQQFHPVHIAAVFDGEKNKESRTALYAEYKAHRKPIPDELLAQIKEAERFCKIMGIATLAIPCVEADDTMGSIAKWAQIRGTSVFICTSDKDMVQLVNDKIKLLNPFKDYLLIDKEKVEELYGVLPEQMQDFLSLVGDASDNIPGVEGFGPKTATALLQQYGSLDNILANCKTIGGKKGLALEQQKETALLSKQLVAINYTVDFPHEEHFFALGKTDEEALFSFLKEKGFHSLIKTLTAHERVHEGIDQKRSDHCVIHTTKQLETLLNSLISSSKPICVDTETTNIRPLEAKLVGIGLGVTPKETYYIPFNGSLSPKEILPLVKDFFESKQLQFFGHNIKYDYHILKNCNIELGTIATDTILASYVLNAHQKRHSIDELSLQYFNKKKIATEELIGKGRSQKTMEAVAIEKVAEYCCEDVEYTIRLKGVLEEELEKRNLTSLLQDIEIPLIKILAKMERHGIFVDCDMLKQLAKEAGENIAVLEEEIYHLAGEPFNINSPKQLSEILFDKLAIKPLKHKNSSSTRAEILEMLAPTYPIAQKILEYRTLEKLRSTYIEKLPEEINPETHRIHTQFNQSVTATGRLSCQDPNLQNIPVRTELGKKIRSSFRPQQEGWSFLSSDYSQIELRILAHVSEDPGLVKAFQEDLDIHAFTASEIFHVPLQSVTSDMRHKAKGVNFGIIYGQQAFGLSQQLGISVQEAASFISTYFKRYPRVRECIESLKQQAHDTHKALTLTGRERLIPDITSSNQMILAQAERLAVNTPFQGTAADIIKLAMIDIDCWMQTLHCKAAMLLQIHDELLFEMPDSEISLLQGGIRQRMEGAFILKIPIKVEISIGKNWMEC